MTPDVYLSGYHPMGRINRRTSSERKDGLLNVWNRWYRQLCKDERLGTLTWFQRSSAASAISSLEKDLALLEGRPETVVEHVHSVQLTALAARFTQPIGSEKATELDARSSVAQLAGLGAPHHVSRLTQDDVPRGTLFNDTRSMPTGDTEPI